MTTQEVLVFVTVSLASIYLVRKLFGGGKKKRQRRGAPDVPVSALLRKKHEAAGKGSDPTGGASGGCH